MKHPYRVIEPIKYGHHPASPPADSNTPRSDAGSDEASPSETQDSQDAQSGTQDGTGAGAVDASAPKSTGGAKKNAGKK